MTANSPYDLRVDGGGDSFAVTGSRPSLTWKLPPARTRQEQVEIEATIDTVAQERAVRQTDRHVGHEWPWRDLRSTETVTWRIRTVCDGETSEWSDWSSFEAGLFDDDWTSQWIRPIETETRERGPRPAYRLSTDFDVPGRVDSARLYGTAMGVYEVFVNGSRVGDTELAPGAASYDRTVYAQAFEVATGTFSRRNRIEVLLSDGWFRGAMGAFREQAAWGESTAIRLELHLALADGSRQVVRSDESWTSELSEITRADLMDGQTTNYTHSSGAARSVTVTSDVTARIDWSPAPPVRRIESRAHVASDRRPNGAWIVDFGQNASGWISLQDLGPEGTRTTIDYGEHLDATGELTTTHLDGVRQEDVFPFVQRDVVVSSGEEDLVFEPRHTVHGFRYARVERGDADLDLSSLQMQVIHTDLRETGTFACSNDDLNRLHDIARWSFRSNAVDIPTDCPTRERLGWTGDYQVFAPTAVRLFDVLGFSRKWLQSVRDDQLDDGRVANFSPDGRRIKTNPDAQMAMMTGSSGWGDAIVLVPWEMYETYGDPAVLSENWDAMVRWVEWALLTAANSRHPSRVERSATPLPHEKFIWDGSFHWGEWLEPRPRAEDGSYVNEIQTNPMAWFMADKGEVGTAFLAKSTKTLSRIADVLGRDDAARKYAEIAELVESAWRREFLHANGLTQTDTQAAYVRALSFDLIPPELREASADRLRELIRAAGTHLATGFLSTADLLPVLADAGHAPLAYELLLQRTSPSWLGMLDRGATTVWEDWDGVDENGNAHESLNHYSKGAVIRFLHTHTLGLRQAPGSTGWESIVVAPILHESIDWARGSFESPQGSIEVEWKRVGTDIELAVQVPQGTTAEVQFPDGDVFRVGPGRLCERRTIPS